VVQLVGLVHDQHDGMFALAHEVTEFALASLRLLGDLDLGAITGRQIVKHGLDERRQRGAALVDRQRLRDRDFFWYGIAPNGDPAWE